MAIRSILQYNCVDIKVLIEGRLEGEVLHVKKKKKWWKGHLQKWIKKGPCINNVKRFSSKKPSNSTNTVQGGGTVFWKCWILFLHVLVHFKSEAFTLSNYISEHHDCLIHSFHYEMKAANPFSFAFTLHKKRTFVGALPSSPWEISSTLNISSLREKQ